MFWLSILNPNYSSRLLTASYFPISSIFLYTSIITASLDGAGESYIDCHGESRSWHHALYEARAEAEDIILRRFRKNAKWDWLLAFSCLLICPFVRPLGKTRLPMVRFSWNLMFEYFSKICRESSVFHYFLTIITGTSYVDLFTFFLSYLTPFFLEWEIFQTNL